MTTRLEEFTVQSHGLLDLLSFDERLLVLALDLVGEGLVRRVYALAAAVRSDEQDLHFVFSRGRREETFK